MASTNNAFTYADMSLSLVELGQSRPLAVCWQGLASHWCPHTSSCQLSLPTINKNGENDIILVSNHNLLNRIIITTLPHTFTVQAT